MKITLDGIIFQLQKNGGVSKYWYNLSKRIEKDSSINHTFLSYYGENQYLNKLNINDQKKIKNFNILDRFKNFDINDKSIFHSSYYRINKGGHNVTTVHDFTYEKYNKGIKKWIHSKQKNIAILNSKDIICVSENTKSDLIKYCKDFIEGKRIHIIPNGISNLYFKPTKSLNPTNFESKEYLLYVGSRIPDYKNFIYCIKLSNKSKCPLVIVGNHLSQKEINLLNNYKINYQSLTNVDEHTLKNIYNNALCLVYPSLYEGFGIPIIEAQASNCPVIAFNNSSIKEVIFDKNLLLKNNCLNSGLDLIKSYKNDDINNILNNGLEFASSFSWDKNFKETKKIYKIIEDEM